jgi:hypothetical protein
MGPREDQVVYIRPFGSIGIEDISSVRAEIDRLTAGYDDKPDTSWTGWRRA